MSSDFSIQLGLSHLQLLKGDITKIRVDAIVNAANSALAGGGGVDGAIHRAGGEEIMRELDAIREKEGGCPTGSAVVTGAGLLPARYVFHAVGPRYRDGRHGESDLLKSCYTKCLKTSGRTRREDDELSFDQHRDLWLSDRGSGGDCGWRGCGLAERAQRSPAYGKAGAIQRSRSSDLPAMRAELAR